MAMQLKNVPKKLFNPAVNVVRHRSRLVPSIFWDDPLLPRQKRLMNDFWNSDPFDFAFPRLVYRSPYNEYEHHQPSIERGFQVSLNVNNFKPDEVSVKVIDNMVIIEAKHEERNENDSHVSRQFSRRYTLPEDCSISEIVSTLSADGILTVRAPPKEIDIKDARNIHIEHVGTNDTQSKSSKITDKSSDTDKN